MVRKTYRYFRRNSRYLLYYFRNRDNLLFNKYRKGIVRKRIIIKIDPMEILYAFPWQVFLNETFHLKGVNYSSQTCNHHNVSSWMRELFYFDYLNENIINIIPGNWDKLENLVKFNDSLIFKAYKYVYVPKRKWQDTDYYKYFKTYIYPENKTKLQNRMIYNDLLLKSVEHKGFDENIFDNAIEQYHPEAPKQLNGPIRIAIGRKNRTILVDGNHRLAIAKILKIKQIDARITLVNDKNELANYL